MRRVNLYILGQQREARNVLNTVSAGRIIASDKVLRGRLLVLLFLLRSLVRLFRISFVANLFLRRWHIKHELKSPVTLRSLFANIAIKFQPRRQEYQR